MERDQLIALVTKAQQGDNDALNTLFNEYYNSLYYFALKTVKDNETALDVTQEAFVEIIKSIDSLKEPAAFVTWAKRITYYQCTRYFKKKKDVIVDETEDGATIFDTLKEENTEFIPDEALDKADFKKTILAILDELSEEQRSATMMYYFDEMSIKEIAEVQNVSEGTVKSRLNYARKAIKNGVEDYEKKHNTKLYAIPFFPFFKWIFEGSFEGSLPTASAEIIAEGVNAATGSAVTVAGNGAAGTAATAAASTSAVSTAANGAGLGAKIAAMPIATKVIAGVVAASIAVGGTTAAVLIAKNSDIKSIAANSTMSKATISTNITTQPAPQATQTHTHDWADPTMEQAKVGPITVERSKERTCTSCGEVEQGVGQWDYRTPLLGEDYYTFLDRYFETAGYFEGDFSINGLFAAGDFLIVEPLYNASNEGPFEVSATEYYNTLKKYFALSDSVIAEMKAKRPGDTYTIDFQYNGSNLMDTLYIYNGGNKFTIYYTPGGSPYSDLYNFMMELEYVGKGSIPSKITALKPVESNYYDMSKVNDTSTPIEALIKKTLKETDGYGKTLNSIVMLSPKDVTKQYNMFMSMNYLGYEMSEEEFIGSSFGWLNFDTEGDAIRGITATFSLPLDSWDYDSSGIRTTAAKRDIEKFKKLIGAENLSARIDDDKTQGIKEGLENITDEDIENIVNGWFGDEKIYLSNIKPITVGSIKCNLSLTITSPQGLDQSAYHAELNLSFID